MCPLYMFLGDPSSLYPHYPLPLTLWLLSVCSLFQCFWLYFAYLFVLLKATSLLILVEFLITVTLEKSKDEAVVLHLTTGWQQVNNSQPLTTLECVWGGLLRRLFLFLRVYVHVCECMHVVYVCKSLCIFVQMCVCACVSMYMHV